LAEPGVQVSTRCAREILRTSFVANRAKKRLLSPKARSWRNLVCKRQRAVTLGPEKQCC
jgi:hypothetical protein